MTLQPYIYKITDLRKNKAIVGKTDGKDENYYCSGVLIRNIIKKYGRKEADTFLKREIIVQGNFNHLLLSELEKHYIRLHGTRAPLGYNLTDGGEGVSGHKHSDTTRALLSKKSKDIME